MSETTEQYRTRLYSYVGDADPFALLESAPSRLAALLQRANAEQAGRAPDGKWTIRQIVGHLSDGELVFGYRLRTIHATPGCEIAGYDQDVWSSALHHAEIDPWMSHARYAHMRAWTVDFLKRINRDEWEHYGMHSERGRESIADLVRLTAGHDINHRMQVEKLLA